MEGVERPARDQDVFLCGGWGCRLCWRPNSSRCGQPRLTAAAHVLGRVVISAESHNLADRERSVRDGVTSTALAPADLLNTAGVSASSAAAAPSRDGFLQILWRQRIVV